MYKLIITSQFDRARMISYCHSIVTIVSFPIYSQILVKNNIFIYSTCIQCPIGNETVGISLRHLILGKPEWRHNRMMWWRKYDDMLSCFDTILECNRRTDRQNSYISVVHQHCCANAWQKTLGMYCHGQLGLVWRPIIIWCCSTFIKWLNFNYTSLGNEE